MYKHKFQLSLVLVTILLCYSCQNEDLDQGDVNLDEKSLSKDARETKAFLMEQGYSDEDLIVDHERKSFVVGDAHYSFSLFKNIKKSKLNQPQEGEKNQWFFGGYGVYYSNSRDITYYYENNFPGYLEYAFSWATYHWSSVSPNINYRRTYDRNTADILVSSYYDSGDRAWARAQLPSGLGNVGSWVSVNTYQPIDDASDITRMTLFIHELGHNLGYHHSDGTLGGLIPGTRGAAYHAANDCGSIMKSSVYNCGWRLSSNAAWTYDDWISIHWAYGLY